MHSKIFTKEELVEKIGMENLALILNNVYCVECGPTVMVDYDLFSSYPSFARIVE